jgi:hypothetical protein
MCGAPERLSAFGAHIFPTVITISMVQGLNEIIAGVDYPLRCMYRSRAYYSQRIHFFGRITGIQMLLRLLTLFSILLVTK